MLQLRPKPLSPRRPKPNLSSHPHSMLPSLQALDVRLPRLLPVGISARPG